MHILCPALKQGVLDDRFGKHGTQWKGDMPSRSFPLEIVDAPPETKSFALVFDDPDSVNVCGFVWIHWMVANLQKPFLEENASITDHSLVQGMNSWGNAKNKESRLYASCYGGPAPPDRPHTYRIRVWALDSLLPLENGFTKDQLMDAMESHILAEASLSARYST